MKHLHPHGLLLPLALLSCTGDIPLVLTAPSSQVGLLLDLSPEGHVDQVELLAPGRGVLARERHYGDASGTLALLSFDPSDLNDTPGLVPERLDELRAEVAAPPEMISVPFEAQGLFVRRALPASAQLQSVHVEGGEPAGEPSTDLVLRAAVLGQLTLLVPVRATDICPDDGRQLALFGDFSIQGPSRVVRLGPDQLLILARGKLLRVGRGGVVLEDVQLNLRTSSGVRLNVSDLRRDPVRRSDGTVTAWIAACQVDAEDYCITDVEGAVFRVQADETGVRNVETATRTVIGVNALAAYGGRALAVVPEGRAYFIDQDGARVVRTPDIDFNAFADGVDGVGYTPDPEHPALVGAHGDLHRYNRSDNTWKTWSVPGLGVNVYAVSGGYDAAGTLELYAAGSRATIASQSGERPFSMFKLSAAAEIANCLTTSDQLFMDINEIIVAGNDLYGTLEKCAVLFRYGRKERCTGAVTLEGLPPGSSTDSIYNLTVEDDRLTAAYQGVIYDLSLSGL